MSQTEPVETPEETNSPIATSESDASSPDDAPTPTQNQQIVAADKRSTDAGKGRGRTRPRMSNEEALEKLRRGELIQNVRIGRLTLSGTFEHPLRFRNVRIDQLSFQKVISKGEVELVASTLRHFELNETTFNKSLTFTNTTVDRFSSSRKRCRFLGDFDIHGCQIGAMTMRRSIVEGKFSARGAEFLDEVNISQWKFLGGVDFWAARFHKWFNLRNCRLEGTLDFRNFHAHEGFNLESSEVLSDLLMRGSTVEKKCSLNQIKLHGLLDLSKAKLHDFAYLDAIIETETLAFAFENAVAERILIEPSQLTGRLRSENEGDFATAAREYGILKRNYEALHRHDDEDWAFYRFKISRRRARPSSWWRPWIKLGRFLDWLLLDVGCGYGTSPMSAVGAAVVLILSFAVVYFLFPSMLPLEQLPFAPGTGIGVRLPLIGSDDEYGLANRIVIGLFTSVSTFTDGLGGLRETSKGWMNLVLMTESLMGTLLWGLFIVAFSRKVIR